MSDPMRSDEIAPPSIWFPAPDYGMLDATAEELTAEPEDVKALRMLRVLRAYVGQDDHPFAAVKLDRNELAVMNMRHFTALMDSVQWLYNWQLRAVNLLGLVRDAEVLEYGWEHMDELEQLLADEFEDGDDA